MKGKEAIDQVFYHHVPLRTIQRVTQPGGEFLLGLPTLLTTHHVNAEGNMNGKKRRIINNPNRLMHRVSCMPFLPCFLQKEEREWRTAQRKTSLSVLSNPILTLRQHKHEQALSFVTCEEKRRVDWGRGKATEPVSAQIRHMHRKHSAYTNPTCALRTHFVSRAFHFSFVLCRAKEVNTQTPNEHKGDNPSVLTKQPPRTQGMRVTSH